MTGSMAREESAPERMGGVSESGRQKQYLFTNNDLKRLIAPLIVEQILAVTVGMVDTMMVSSAGEAATSGVSLVDMINNLLINVFAAVSTGGAVVSSQFLGQKNRKRACEAADQLMMITGLISIVIMVGAILFRHGLLRLLYGGIADDVMNNALIYLILSALSYPFLAIYIPVRRCFGPWEIPGFPCRRLSS